MATVEKLNPFYELLLRGDKTGQVVGGHVIFWDILKIDDVTERENVGSAVPIAEMMANPAYAGTKAALADLLSEALLAQQAALDTKIAECEKHAQELAAKDAEHQAQLAAISEQVVAANQAKAEVEAKVADLEAQVAALQAPAPVE